MRQTYNQPLMKAKKVNFSFVQLMVIVISVILFSTFTSPQINLSGRGLRLSLPLFISLIVITLLKRPSLFDRQLRRHKRTLLLGIVFISMSFFRNLIDPNPIFFQNQVLSGIVCLCLWVTVLVIKRVFPEGLETIRWWTLIIFGLSLGAGIPLLINEPGIARLTMGNINESFYTALYFPHGIANYSWYTPVGFAWPVIANWITNSYLNKLQKFLGWFALILISIATLLSTFTMANVLLGLGFFVWLALQIVNGKKMSARIFSFIILIIILVSFSSVFVFGLDFNPTSFVFERVRDMFQVFIDSRSISDADPTIRTALFLETMKTFSKHPIFGVWGQNFEYFVGGHSSWADTFAINGIFGSIFLIGFMFTSKIRNSNASKLNNWEPNTILSWSLIAVGGILNPTFLIGLGLMLIWLFDGRVFSLSG